MVTMTSRIEGRRVMWLTVAEAAARLGVSQWTVVRWIRSGRLPASRPGHAYRVREEHVAALLVERSFR
jgi:excisionase family DNA binding protein